MLPGIETVVFIFVGAFFRRFWGGWEGSDVPEAHFFKIGVCLALSILLGVLTFHYATTALFFGGAMLVTFLNPFHSKGQRMGFGGPPSLVGSVLWMSGSYGVLAFLVSGITAWSEKAAWPLLFAPLGLLASGGYLIAFYVLPRLSSTFNPNAFTAKVKLGNAYLIDGPPAIGELCLGALLIGGMPLINAVVG
jgi:hypothetical protein